MNNSSISEVTRCGVHLRSRRGRVPALLSCMLSLLQWQAAAGAVPAVSEVPEVPAEPADFPFGVLRAWVAQGGGAEDPLIRSANISLGDVLVVEVKNFNGWLIEQVDKLHTVDDDLLNGASEPVKAIVRNGSLKRALDAHQVINAAKDGILTTKKIQEFIETKILNIEDRNVIETQLNAGHPPELPRHPLADGPQILNAEDVVPAVLQLPMFQALNRFFATESSAPSTAVKTAILVQDAPLIIKLMVQKKASELKLLFNDLELTGVSPTNSKVMVEGRRPNDDYFWYYFPITENSENTAVWQQLRKRIILEESIRLTLNCPFAGRSLTMNTAIKYVPKKSNTEDGKPKPGNYAVRLVIINDRKLAMAILVMALCLGLFAAGALRTDMVRDTQGIMRPDGILPYSLARAQMAFWFILVVGSFLFLYISLNKIPELNDTCLWLIGIGAGTALGAAVITEEHHAQEGGAGAWPLVRLSGERRNTFIRRLAAEIALKEKAQALAPKNEALEERLNELTATLNAKKQSLVAAQTTELAALQTAIGELKSLIETKTRELAGASKADKAAIQKVITEKNGELTQQTSNAQPALDRKIKTLHDEIVLLRREHDEKEIIFESAREAANPEFLGKLAQLKRQQANCNLQSKNRVIRLLDDWMTEQGHYSFHRYQMLIWTLVLGLVFFFNVGGTRSLPVFDSTLLALLGISNGTYLGFRLPAVKKEKEQALG